MISAGNPGGPGSVVFRPPLQMPTVHAPTSAGTPVPGSTPIHRTGHQGQSALFRKLALRRHSIATLSGTARKDSPLNRRMMHISTSPIESDERLRRRSEALTLELSQHFAAAAQREVYGDDVADAVPPAVLGATVWLARSLAARLQNREDVREGLASSDRYSVPIFSADDALWSIHALLESKHDGDIVVLGRDKSCDAHFVNSSGMMAPRQASIRVRIRPDGSRHYEISRGAEMPKARLRDGTRLWYESYAATYVNDEPLTAMMWRELQDGDIIELGDHIFAWYNP